ncbi:MAG: hypothetical protein IPJ04_15690 [Candidatus Eisenbacteria bacterium]|nr:hypothetical protein [Candidatus Eisenbacteria bacterium]
MLGRTGDVPMLQSLTIDTARNRLLGLDASLGVFEAALGGPSLAWSTLHAQQATSVEAVAMYDVIDRMLIGLRAMPQGPGKAGLWTVDCARGPGGRPGPGRLTLGVPASVDVVGRRGAAWPVPRASLREGRPYAATRARGRDERGEGGRRAVNGRSSGAQVPAQPHAAARPIPCVQVRSGDTRRGFRAPLREMRLIESRRRTTHRVRYRDARSRKAGGHCAESQGHPD